VRTSARRSALKLVVLGDSGCGKTALLTRLVYRRYQEEYEPTLGGDFFAHKLTVGTDTVHVSAWDTAGQERYRSLGSAFYRGAHACCLVFDLQQPGSLATNNNPVLCS